MITPMEYLVSINGCKANVDKNINKFIDKVIKTFNLHTSVRFTKAFSPHGITTGYILTESHIIAHTYPEHKLVLVNLFLCKGRLSDFDIETLQILCEEHFKPLEVDIQRIKRY